MTCRLPRGARRRPKRGAERGSWETAGAGGALSSLRGALYCTNCLLSRRLLPCKGPLKRWTKCVVEQDEDMHVRRGGRGGGRRWGPIGAPLEFRVQQAPGKQQTRHERVNERLGGLVGPAFARCEWRVHAERCAASEHGPTATCPKGGVVLSV
jgi:hypothetical protein